MQIVAISNTLTFDLCIDFADMPFYICSTHMTTADLSITNGAQKLVGVTFYLLNKWPAFCPSSIELRLIDTSTSFSTLRWTRSRFILGRAVIVLFAKVVHDFKLFTTLHTAALFNT